MKTRKLNSADAGSMMRFNYPADTSMAIIVSYDFEFTHSGHSQSHYFSRGKLYDGTFVDAKNIAFDINDL